MFGSCAEDGLLNVWDFEKVHIPQYPTFDTVSLFLGSGHTLELSLGSNKNILSPNH